MEKAMTVDVNQKVNQRDRDRAVSMASCPVCGAPRGVRCVFTPKHKHGVKSGDRNGRRRIHPERLDAVLIELPPRLPRRARRSVADQVGFARKKRDVTILQVQPVPKVKADDRYAMRRQVIEADQVRLREAARRRFLDKAEVIPTRPRRIVARARNDRQGFPAAPAAASTVVVLPRTSL